MSDTMLGGAPLRWSEQEKKRYHARALHDAALRLALIPGCEVHANVVSREAAKLDAEIAASPVPPKVGT